MNKVSGLEAVYRDYKSKGVKFFFVYKSLAHPETNGFIQPYTLQERIKHAKIATEKINATIPWLVDAIDNRLKHALGDRPNSEFIIDPKGMIVRSRGWSSPDETRKDLEKLVGPVKKVTSAREVNIKMNLGANKKQEVATGVVKRVQRSRMRALKFEAKSTKNAPFLAKLRPEADTSLMNGGRGKLYLGFHLDRIYEAHWNNAAGALKLQIEAPDGVKISKKEWTAPKPDVNSDADPRELLVDVENWRGKEGIKVSVRYFACEGDRKCLAISQEYTIYNRSDRDGGSARSGRGGGGFAGGDRIARMFTRYDRNKDGKLSKEEAPRQMQRMFARADANQDGMLTKAELEKAMQNFRRPGGGGNVEARLRRIMQSDRNRDGKISKEEAPFQLRRMFDRADRNNDGQLDKSELTRMFERMRRPGR